MKVELLHSTPVEIVVKAIRKCYDSGSNSDSMGDKDKALIKRVIESGHHSVLEHIHFTFDIDGVSRGLLQQFARHRIGVSPSVRSTRYTLGRIKKEERPLTSQEGLASVDKYLVKTGIEFVDYNSVVQLEEVRQGALAGIPNDDLKYMLPESFKTSMIVTFNARSLRHFFELRLESHAHWEIRQLSQAIVNVIPHKYALLFEDILAQYTH